MKLTVPTILLLAAHLLAGPTDAGRPAAQLRQGVGARALALGRAYGAEKGDAVAFLYNPAASAGLNSVSLALQQAYLPVEREMQYLGFARPVSSAKGRLFYGVGVTRMTLAKPIERRSSSTPEPLYTFSETRYSGHLTACGWALKDLLSLGLGFHYLSHQLGEAQAGGYGFDLGGRWEPWSWLRVGVAANDAVGRMTWSTGWQEDLPLVTREALGASLPLSFILDGELEQAWIWAGAANRWKLGLEWSGLGGALALRGGVDSGHPAAGLGLSLERQGWSWSLDYAAAAEDGAAGWLQHRVSLGLVLPNEETGELKGGGQ